MNFEKIGQEIGRLVEEKNAAYGDAFSRAGRVLRELYPKGIEPEQYDDMFAVIRIVDKLCRIATDRDALGESPYRDIAGYGILGAERVERIRHASSEKIQIKGIYPGARVTDGAIGASIVVGGPIESPNGFIAECLLCGWNKKSPDLDGALLARDQHIEETELDHRVRVREADPEPV